jgi:hypothetical protein
MATVHLEELNLDVDLREVTTSCTIEVDVLDVELCDTPSKSPLCPDELSVTIKEESLEVTIKEEVFSVELVECIKAVEGGAGGSVGEVFVLDVTGTGIIADKTYEPNTVPPNTVLISCLTDENSVTVHFMAHGGENYSPVITVGGVQCTNLQQYSNDLRIFFGSVTIQVTEDIIVPVNSDAGGTTSVEIFRAAAGPNVLTAIIGDYPGTQTAAKQGDTIEITGTVDIDATEVRVVPFGAFISGNWVSCSNGIFSLMATVNNGSGLFLGKVEARNSIGTIGIAKETSNNILLDQLYPIFSNQGTTFPTGQHAFKDYEVGHQNTSILNADVFSYSSPNNDFTIENETVYDLSKTITCTNPNHYNDSTVNFKIVATRSANAAQSTFNKVIEVADTAPTVSVTQPISRLRSSPTGYNYAITASSNQNLASAPDVDIPVSGTWVGTGFTGGPKQWNRSITIFDSDAKGSGVWVWGTAPTNNAGIPALISGTQVVGGFRERDIELAPFATESELGTSVTNSSKLVMSWSFKDPMFFQAIGTSPPVASGWTIDSLFVTPTVVEILDTAAANSSSQTSIITISEVA